MEIPKVENLPPEFLVQVRVSEWELWVWPLPKRLPHGLTLVLHEGVPREECSLKCGVGGLPFLSGFVCE